MIHSFQYIIQNNLETSLSILDKYQERAKIIAGGTDLKLLLEDEFIHPDFLIDISMIPNLNTISEIGGKLVIGATATLSNIEKSHHVINNALILSEAAGRVGSPQIRNLGTIGGNLCNSSPAADTVTPLIVLGAELKFRNINEEKMIATEDFFKGVKKNILGTSDILTEIHIPAQPPRTGTAFMKFSRGNGPDLSLVNVSVKLTINDGKVSDSRIAFGAVAPTPIRARQTEETIIGNELEDDVLREAGEVALREVNPITDVRTSRDHRLDLCSVLLKRALELASYRTRG
jgi:carbon-monoxide dehydrogenase medium subunit